LLWAVTLQPGCAGQRRGQKVGIHPIVSLGDLNDNLIHLNKFFMVAEAVIPVDVASLEFVLPPDLSEWSR
jgi:hypothetical protein